MPEHLRPEFIEPAAPASAKKVQVDETWYGIASHWQIVAAELLAQGVDLRSRTVLEGSWLSLRAAIFLLLNSDSRLRAALTRR